MDIDNEDHVILNNVKGNVVGLSPVLDYLHCPAKYKDMTLYDWVHCAVKSKFQRAETRQLKMMVTCQMMMTFPQS